MPLDSTTLNKVTHEIAEMFPRMSQENVDCVTAYMGKHTDQWSSDDIPGGVKKCLPIALVNKDHTAYLLLGIIVTMFVNMFINLILYIATSVYNVPFKNKNIDPVIM